MKVVINRCYGGFSLSAQAVKRLAELQGRECYFFTLNHQTEAYEPADISKCRDPLFWFAFDIPNPNDVLVSSKAWCDLPMEERRAATELHSKHDLTNRPDNRHDPLLIQVVEELGGGHRSGASGDCADLKIVEIPDGLEYEIDEYGGMESIHEVHRSWR